MQQTVQSSCAFGGKNNVIVGDTALNGRPDAILFATAGGYPVSLLTRYDALDDCVSGGWLVYPSDASTIGNGTVLTLFAYLP